MRIRRVVLLILLFPWAASGGERVRIHFDVPSGLDATTGEVQGACVRARATITFGLPKKGFFSKEARAFTGKVIVRDIGFPRELISK